jgi:hypothetical protein
VDSRDPIQQWQAHFGPCVPIGSLMLGSFRQRWTRFCALPHCDRLPEQQDLAAALERVNVVTREVLGKDALLIIACELDQHGNVSRDLLDVGGSRLTKIPIVWTRALHDHVVEPDSASFWIATAQLPFARHESIFERILMDRWGTLTMMSLATGDAVCPYEGGVDTFVGDAEKRSHLRAHFQSWIWSLPAGAPQPR